LKRGIGNEGRREEGMREEGMREYGKLVYGFSLSFIGKNIQLCNFSLTFTLM